MKVSESEDGRVKFEAYPPNIRRFLVQLSLEALLNLRVGVQHILADIDDAVARQSRPRQEQPAERDRLLSPEEAAGQFSVTKRWLLDHADDVPGSRRLSRKVIRFSGADYHLPQWEESGMTRQRGSGSLFREWYRDPKPLSGNSYPPSA
jgi:hypothetical protein